MSTGTATAARLHCLGVLSLTALFFAVATSLQAASPLIQVEQDWELVVGEPDQETDSPQIVCVISPTSDTNSVHAVFELNQQTLPEFSAGGMQLQIWQGETELADRRVRDTVPLTQSNETITWTLRMSLMDGILVFAVLNGHSETWQTFGGYSSLAIAVRTSLTSLEGYDAGVSMKSSGVSFAPDRVKTFTLKKTRYYSADGTVQEDATACNVAIHQ